MSLNSKFTLTRLVIPNSYKRQDVYSIALVAFFGFFLSITQIFGESPDYPDYDGFFDLVRFAGQNILITSRFEPGFSFLSLVLTNLFDSNVVVYAWIVFASILIKSWAINVFSSSRKIFFVVVVFYFVRYFPLHELTQLRAACSIGFLMVAAFFLWNESRFYGLFKWNDSKLYGLLACSVSMLFHMSAALMIPALFFQPTKRWQVIKISFLCLIVVFTGTSFISEYLAKYISVFAGYQEFGFGDDTPNPFSSALLLDWVMIVSAFIKWDSLSLLMKRIIFLEMIGMAVFYGAFEFPVIAHRFREMISVFWVFFVADGLRLKALKIPTTGFAMLSIGLYSYFFIFSGKFFH